MSTNPVVAAAEREAVLRVMNEWAEAFRKESPDAILSLYHEEAVLWGTVSPMRRDDPEAIRDYFVNAFKVWPGHQVTFQDHYVRLFGDRVAVNTGYYTFSWTQDGNTKMLPARFSFTLVKLGDTWRIVDHHSSAVPSPDLLK